MKFLSRSLSLCRARSESARSRSFPLATFRNQISRRCKIYADRESRHARFTVIFSVCLEDSGQQTPRTDVINSPLCLLPFLPWPRIVNLIEISSRSYPIYPAVPLITYHAPLSHLWSKKKKKKKKKKKYFHVLSLWTGNYWTGIKRFKDGKNFSGFFFDIYRKFQLFKSLKEWIFFLRNEIKNGEWKNFVGKFCFLIFWSRIFSITVAFSFYFSREESSFKFFWYFFFYQIFNDSLFPKLKLQLTWN